MKQWLCSELPEGCSLFEIPALALRRGKMRLQVVQRILGPSEAQLAVEKAGPYLLADELCQNLRLRGLELPENGEVPCLSPNRWQENIATLPLEAEVFALFLSDSQEKALKNFFHDWQQPQNLSQFLEIAQHFFYEESLKVAVRYTAPRFKPS